MDIYVVKQFFFKAWDYPEAFDLAEEPLWASERCRLGLKSKSDYYVVPSLLWANIFIPLSIGLVIT